MAQEGHWQMQRLNAKSQRGTGAKVFVATAIDVFESGGNRRRSCRFGMTSRQNAAGRFLQC
jgi:hypothetical protein